jgi:hypothetical protein
MWYRLPRVNVRCTSPKEQAENWKNTEEMHTVSEIRALQTETIERGSEDRHTEKLASVLFPERRAKISTPRTQT